MQLVSMSRTRIRDAVRNIGEAAVADGLTTQVADVTVVAEMAAETVVPAPVAPIIQPTCRAAMPRALRPRARMRRAATPNPLPVRTAAEIMVVAIARAATAVAAAAADTRVAALPAQAAAEVAVDSRAARAPAEVVAAAVSRAAANPAAGLAAGFPA
jgi:hypothetical protein